MKKLNLKKTKLNSSDLVVLTHLFERPMFGSLLMGQIAEEERGADWFPTLEVMRSLRKLCELNLVRGFPEPVPRGPLLGAYYSINGSGKELLLMTLANESWLGRDSEKAEIWTLLTDRLGFRNFSKIARRAGPKTKFIWRKFGINYLETGVGPFLAPWTFAKT